ncbi:hypothetical protein KBF38_23865 [bacterium]|nr:hypothetical protein [bacterium]
MKQIVATTEDDVTIPRIRYDAFYRLSSLHKMLIVKCDSADFTRQSLFRVENAFCDDLDYKPNFDINECDCQIYPAVTKGRCYRGFIFFEKEKLVGGCLFRWHNDFISADKWWLDRHPHGCWALQWVWLRRQSRRKDILTKAWPVFRRLFGIRPEFDFFIEEPYSANFLNFLEHKMGYSVRRPAKWMHSVTWTPSPVENLG